MAQSLATPVAAARDLAFQDIWAQLRSRLEQRLRHFEHSPPTPAAVYTLEKDLQAAFDDTGRALLAETFNRCEPAAKDEAAPHVRYQRQAYRINKRTKAQVATTFGPITLWSWLYLAAEDGEPGLHPLHVRLGIAAGGATPLLAERVARCAVDFSQREVRQWLATEHGLKWSNDRLRRLLRDFRRAAVTFRAEAQERRLLQWLGEAARSRGRHRPVLAVGRDGVLVPMRGAGYQEASVATLSVYDRRGQRLGTVYLGQMPQAQQQALTAALTALVTGVLRRWDGPPPRLVYVTDKGQAQDSYYRRVLRRLADPRRPGQRLAWQWVLDFFHVCGYVAKLREALFGNGGWSWFERMRRWLRERRQGVANILRSAMQHWGRRRLSQARRRAFWKAYRYLRRHSRWMEYGRYRRQGLPIGSGVTEAACKTVITQRLKRSGMRWQAESGQVIVDLRVLYLSGIWDEVVANDLRSRELPEAVEKGSSPPRRRRTHKNAA
jgi:hypothetical protein